jgi:hypothetical protein
MVLRFIFVLLIWFSNCSVVTNPLLRPVFGVRISFQPITSQMISLIGYLDNGRTLTHQKTMTIDEFVKFASGFWPSVYNPKRINYLEQNNVPCGLEKDAVTRKDIPFCGPLDSLWKIRFSDYPFNNGTEKGWSNEIRKPSPKQAIYIFENYGVRDVDLNYFMDTSFWKLLHDVQDPTWIANYRSLR